MTRLEKLLLRVEMIDKVSGTASRVSKSINSMIDSVKGGFGHIAAGTGGIMGVSYALDSLKRSAQEMNDTMDEMASLGLADDVLKRLQKSALNFSVTYGTSAIDFVKSAYGVQSRIKDLTGGELNRFVAVGNLMAQGMHSSVDTMTGYLSDMYGRYQKNADAMGKTNWVQKLAGQTELAVRLSGRAGENMPNALGALGAAGTANRIAIEEQMGVLANLQHYMDGASAGTKYVAFLKNVGNAQEALGLKFVDSKGMLLPITDILGKIQKKYGDLDTKAKNDLMQKAFAKGADVVKLLSKDISGLKTNISELGTVDSLDRLNERALALADPFGRIESATEALKISFGGLIMESLVPLYTSITENIIQLNDWVNMFPHLAGLIAKITLFIFGFTVAVSLLSIAKGLWIITATGVRTSLMLLRLTMLPFGPLLTALRMAWVIFNVEMAAGAGVMGALRAALVAFRVQLVLSTMSTLLMRSVMLVARLSMMAFTGTIALMRAGLLGVRMTMLATALLYPAMGAGMAALATGFGTASAATWAFTAALLANPVTWIVIGVVALVAGLYMLIKHWDGVSIAVTNFFTTFAGYWNVFRSAIESNPVAHFLLTPLFLMVDAVTWVVQNLDKIPQWFGGLTSALKKYNPLQPLIDGVSWLIEKLAKIPGVKTLFGFKAVDAPGAEKIPAIQSPKIPQAPTVAPKIPERVAAVAAISKPPVVTQPPMPAQPTVIEKIPFSPAGAAVEKVKIPQPLADQKVLQMPESVAKVASIESDPIEVQPLVTPIVQRRLPVGGIASQINNANNQRSVNIEKLEVNTTQQVNGKRLMDELHMAAG